MKAIAKFAPASQAASRTSICPSSPMPMHHDTAALSTLMIAWRLTRRLGRNAEAPGQELKAITKSAPASQAASRTSTRPSSPMPIPAPQPSASGAQAREPEQALGSSPPGSGLSAKSVTFSKSMPKDMAQLPSRCRVLDATDLTCLAHVFA